MRFLPLSSALAGTLVLAGCAGAPPLFGGGVPADASVSDAAASEAGAVRPVPRPTDGGPSGEDAGADDPETRVAAAPGYLGDTLATLGDATDPGLWLETPLVEATQAGRLTAVNGRTVEVTLRPAGGARGAGSRISLAAMQALGLSLTAIAPLRVDAL